MVKTRFAPSPTGYLHVGSLRTALYCYLFARAHNGTFVLRIEDTDQTRYVEGAVENLISTLEWCGLTYDEGPLADGTEKGEHGPYTQSHRTEIYRTHAEQLLESGHAYRCFCTKERLEEMRARQIELKHAPMYDRHCLDLPHSEIEKKLQEGIPYVIRQKIPYETIRFRDLIRGKVQFDGKSIDDQILVKSDGFPTYHLANVVDDHLMEITHVIRGEEWLPSTPKHLALYQSFGWQPPEFAHLPLLLNPDRSKLSKRQGDVAVEDYIKKGYLKEAILNFIVFLGWNPGSGEEQEIFTLEELVKKFTLEKVHKGGAVFNLEKLDWYNWRWRKAHFLEELVQENAENDPHARGAMLRKMCNEWLPDSYKLQEERLHKALVTVEEKILKDPKTAEEHIHFYFQMPLYEAALLTHEKMRVDLNQAHDSLQKSKERLGEVEPWTLDTIEQTLKKTVEEMGVQNGQVFWPLRAALTGMSYSPGVFEVAWVLGKEETLKRIDHALNLTA